MLEKLKELLSMQRALDESIEKQHNVVIDIKKLKIAMLDEIGELTHELKGDWCWWKKTQAPVDREKVLEELVDVWHFALSIENHKDEMNIEDDDRLINFKAHEIKTDYTAIVAHLMKYETYIIHTTMLLTYKLGFDFEDVYKCYKKKNEVNWQRLKNNY